MAATVHAAGGTPLVPFIHQVGGHAGILHYDEHTICKPLYQRELENYRHLSVVMGEFMPKLKGVIKVGIEKDSEGHVTFRALTVPSLRDSTMNDDDDDEDDEEATSCEYGLKSCLSSAQESNDEDASQSSEMNEGSEESSHEEEVYVVTRRDVNKENSRLAKCQRVHSSPILSSLGDEKDDTTSDNLYEDSTDYSFHPLGRGYNPWSLRCYEMEISKLNLNDGMPAAKHKEYLLLENVSKNYQCPSIMDLKIGTRLYGDDLTEEKKEMNMARAALSTTRTLGVRMGGMQVYHADKGTYVCCNKKYGNILSDQLLREEVRKFVYSGHSCCQEIRRSVISKVRKLKDLISRLDRYRFFGCSVLIVYEGMDNLGKPSPTSPWDDSCSYNPGNVVVKVIDFAHASSIELQAVDGTDYEGADRSFMYGLENLLGILQSGPAEV